MKSLICILLAAFLHPPNAGESLPGGHKLTMQEAERILGESCQLTESTSSLETGGHTYKSTYLANSSDAKSDKIAALSFMFESYGKESDAKKMFETFRAANQPHSGFEMLSNLGDEAFFHSDKKNFYLIIARKGAEMLRFKVNKITPKTSLTELKKVAADLMMRV